MRIGSVRRMRVCLRFFSASAFCLALASLSPGFKVSGLALDVVPLTAAPFTPLTLVRVLGAILSSVPDVTRSALPFVGGESDTTRAACYERISRQ